MSHKPKSTVVFWPRDLLKHCAWLELTGIAPQVYGLFRLRIQVERQRDRREKRTPFVIKNDGHIVFSYVEAKRNFGITSPRFRRALKELVEKGLLDVAHHGGGLEGNPSRYAFSERWRAYGTPDFKIVTLPKGRAWITNKMRPTNGGIRAPTNGSVRG